MPSPFPGMDPWLERPDLWPDVHMSLIVEIRNHLADRLDPRYIVRADVRTYVAMPEELVLVGRPDVAVVRGDADAPEAEPALPAGIPAPQVVTLPTPEDITEHYLEVRSVETEEVVTVIEVISPANKLTGSGRKAYEEKRTEVLRTQTNLVEIDLLRAGKPLPAFPEGGRRGYRILVARGRRRPRGDLWSFGVKDRIPPFPLPLRRGEAEPEVDLKPLIDHVYDQARYARSVDYARDPVPPLEDDDARFADALLRERGARR